MKTLYCYLLATLLFGCSGVVAAVSEYTELINYSEWPEYVNGANVMKIEQVRNVLDRFEEHEKVKIEIRYPGGETGKAWAQSLGRWLVSFGIPEHYLELFPGSGSQDLLSISIIDRR